jgi:hypothetical protein
MTKNPPNDQPDDQGSAQPEHVLAEIPKGPYDKGSADDGAGAIEIVAGPSRAQPGNDRLILPRGGLISMRRSGGLRFTSRTVTVFRDGTVTVEDRATGARPAGKLDDPDLAELYRALDTANFPELPPVSGHQNPDAYAYEIAARIARTNYALETFDGSIPPQLDPLVRLLSGYMKSEE